MPDKAPIRAGRTRMVVVSGLGLGSLGLLWGCVADPGLSSPTPVYGTSAPVYGVEDPYFDESFWGGWGGGYYGGFYGRGFGGTRLYHGGGHGGTRALRGGGFHGAAGGGRHGR